MGGIGSFGGTAQIKDTYESFTADLLGTDYTILGAVETNQDFTPGDSGGPVYELGGTNKFAGIVIVIVASIAFVSIRYNKTN